MQADKRKEDEKTARDTENKARRAMVNEMHDKAQVSAAIICNNDGLSSSLSWLEIASNSVFW